MSDDMISLRLGPELLERLNRVMAATGKRLPAGATVSRSVIVRQALATGLRHFEKDLGLPEFKATKKR